MTQKIISLTKLKKRQVGVVVEFAGGSEVSRRLKSMGIRIGKKVKKVSGMLMFGPVTIQVGHTQLSIGHGMASKVFVEVKK